MEKEEQYASQASLTNLLSSTSLASWSSVVAANTIPCRCLAEKTCFCMNSDNELLTVSIEGVVETWDTQTNTLALKLPVTEGVISCIASHYPFIALANQNRLILYSFATGTIQTVSFKGTITKLVFVNSLILMIQTNEFYGSISYSRSFSLDTSTCAFKKCVIPQKDFLLALPYDIILDAMGRYVIFSVNNKVLIQELKTGKVWNLPLNIVISSFTSSKNRSVFLCKDSKTIYVLTMEQQILEEIVPLQTDTRTLQTFSLREAGKELCEDITVKTDFTPTCCTITASSSLIAVGYKGGIVCIFTGTSSSSKPIVFMPHIGDITALAINESIDLLVTQTAHAIKLWSLSSICSTAQHGSIVYSSANLFRK